MKKLRINFSDTNEKRTFYLHLFYSILDGIILGVLALNEFVLIKGLQGSEYQTAFLFQFTVIVLLFSVPLNQLLKRTVRKRKMIRLVALLTRLPLLILIFFPRSVAEQTDQFMYQLMFLGIFLIYFSANPLIFPIINGFLKTNYKHENFSKYYGYAAFANKIVLLFATVSFGYLLDVKPHAYVYVYPFLAVLGISSIFILTKIPYDPPIPEKKNNGLLRSLKEIFSNLVSIIKRNKPFRDFEIGFLLYGFAWLVTIAVIAIFLNNELELSYSGVAFYKNFYNTVSIILTPFFGRLLGKLNPRKFAAIAFGFMLFYILFMGLSEFFPSYFYIVLFNAEIKIYYTLIVSYLSYGVFGAMMGLLWYIGSAYFSKDEDAADYQSIHLSLTGFRGAFAPLIGIYFYTVFDYRGVFAIGVISLFLAITYMLISIRRHK
jgi:MFS family permease